LDSPEIEEKPERQIDKSFDIEEDMEELGVSLDKKNREILSKEECDSVFISGTQALEDINHIRNKDKEDFKEEIENLKKEALKTEILFASEDFDIFGSISEDRTKISVLGNAKHREIKKNKFRILDITKNTKNKQYVEVLERIVSSLDKALDKSNISCKLNAYYASNLPLNNKDYKILHINPKSAIEELKDTDKINLYSIKLNDKTRGIALTNITYYDNNNKTLPLGMNEEDKILVDMSKLKLELKKQRLFRINQEIDELNIKTKIICVYEYEVVNVEE